MVLDTQRDKVDFALTPVAKKLIRVNPNYISWVALILALVAGIVLYFSFSYLWLLLLGAIIVIMSGYLDALDGKVAKLAGKASRRGDYLDHVFDRYADVLMIGGVAVSGWCNPYLGMVALIGVLLTSYMGTQAQAVGAPRLYSGLLGRADRVVLLTLFPIIQFVMSSFTDYGILYLGEFGISWLEIMMLYFAIIGNFTAIQRAITTWKAMTEEDKEKESNEN